MFDMEDWAEIRERCYREADLIAATSVNRYTPLNVALYQVAAPHVSDLFGILRALPGYRDTDTDFVQDYEARGGKFAPPGALTLAEHDLVHFLCGINFIPYDTELHRKDSERFLSGFQFGADPNFTNEDLEAFKEAVEKHAPEEYQFGPRGRQKFDEGVELGRLWYKRTGINLQEFVQDAIDHNHPLDDVYHEFWSKDGLYPYKQRITTTIRQLLDEVREGVPEVADNIMGSIWPKDAPTVLGMSRWDRDMIRFFSDAPHIRERLGYGS